MPIRPRFPSSGLFRQRPPAAGEACAWCSAAFTTELPIVQAGRRAEDPVYHDRCAVAAYPTHLSYVPPDAPPPAPRDGLVARFRRWLQRRAMRGRS